MAATSTKPIGDTVPKLNDEIAVGENLEFQRKWWVVERLVWIFFTCLIIADFLGAFGRGWLANAKYQTPDKSLDIKYESIERFHAPSILAINFAPSVVQNGKVALWVSDSLVKSLGNQRIMPQPETSAIGEKGILYTFPTSGPQMTVQFDLNPGTIGTNQISFQVPGSDKADLKIWVMP